MTWAPRRGKQSRSGGAGAQQATTSSVPARFSLLRLAGRPFRSPTRHPDALPVAGDRNPSGLVVTRSGKCGADRPEFASVFDVLERLASSTGMVPGEIPGQVLLRPRETPVDHFSPGHSLRHDRKETTR